MDKAMQGGISAADASPRAELLAPAGSLDSLCAAVAAGADAVYTGLGAFNARAANAGLTLDELERACRVAHAHGVRVYVTLNVCVHDGELERAVALAGAACERGADALIVADLGLARCLRAEIPGVELHLSTQAGVQSAPGVEFAARELGVERVTCARELSVAELEHLCATGVHIEAFCHGAICICYSGACSYSALMRGRSANRGDCTQPCRLAYELQDAQGTVLAGGAWSRERAELPSAAPEGDRLLCPRDYLGIRHVAQMLRAGVHAFKIEGRMKGPDYVYNVVRCYRVALDAALEGRDLGDDELDELEAQLARSFSRGFTDGYLRGGRSGVGASLMSVERAINQGLPVGEIVECRHEEVVIAFSRAVSAQDMLEIRSTPGPDAPADVPKRWPIVPCPASVHAGERAVVHCKRRVECGSVVHLVRSVSTIADAERAVEAVRAEAEQLQNREDAHVESMACLAPDAASRGGIKPCGGPRGGAACQTDAASQGGPSWGNPSLPVIDLGEVCRAADLDVVRADCERVRRGEAGAVVCRNLAQVHIACSQGVAWEAAAPINVWNAETVRLLLSLGARRVWLPEELGAEDEQELRSALGAQASAVMRPEPGSTPLMIMEHCLLTAEGPCDCRCAACERRAASQRGERFLVELDRKSARARLQVRVDAFGRTRIHREV
ncbi:MAG: U32 family peptidase [Coriobacteriaceae bacterium]|nr:U32 family peptidase [Coriobacteriaceae bacterium]